MYPTRNARPQGDEGGRQIRNGRARFSESLPPTFKCRDVAVPELWPRRLRTASMFFVSR